MHALEYCGAARLGRHVQRVTNPLPYQKDRRFPPTPRPKPSYSSVFIASSKCCGRKMITRLFRDETKSSKHLLGPSEQIRRASDKSKVGGCLRVFSSLSLRRGNFGMKKRHQNAALGTWAYLTSSLLSRLTFLANCPPRCVFKAIFDFSKETARLYRTPNLESRNFLKTSIL